MLVLVVGFYWVVVRSSDFGSNVSDTLLQMGRIREALTTYAASHKLRYPDTLKDAAKYMPSQEVPTDTWGNPFEYTLISATQYTLLSYGADGRPGGEGEDADIVERVSH